MDQWITTTQLLDELKATGSAPAWDQFCRHFQPVVVNFARQLGLSQADAEDAAQETMAAFFKAFEGGKYDRGIGRLSSWLFGVAKRVILNLRGRRPLEQLIADKTTGTSFWDLIEDDNSIQQTWENEWRLMALKGCLEQVRREFDSKVVTAFELYGLHGIDIEDVCRQLAMSRNAVYIAKSRVLSRLRVLANQFE